MLTACIFKEKEEGEGLGHIANGINSSVKGIEEYRRQSEENEEEQKPRAHIWELKKTGKDITV